MTDIERFIQYINESNNIVFFGGAGVSTESGIPDFRSKDGLYNQHDIKFDMYEPEYLLSHECVYHNPKVFYAFYRQKMDTRNIEPNITHYVLSQLEELGKMSGVVTQNIDGLHQRAGSHKVYEIHGTTQENYCVKCHKNFDVDYIFDSNEAIPKCDVCGRPVRPNVIMYSEELPKKICNEARIAISKADMLIVAGTSLQVYPAASYIYDFSGEHLVVINREDINVQLNPDSDIFIKDNLGKVFTEVDKAIKDGIIK